MFCVRRMCLLWIALAILVTVPAGLSTAQTPDGAKPLGEEARIVDAQWYAFTYKVSLEEALRRLQLQDDIDGLEPALIEQEGETFAGLWIQHTPQFRIVVAFTRNGQETIRPYIEGQPWAEWIEVRPAVVTLAELEAIQDMAVHVLARLGVRADSLIDVVRNHVEVRVTDEVQLNVALQRAGLALPDHVVVTQVAGLMRPVADISGGKALSYCTSGFSVKNSSGIKGVTTAAHCPNTLSYNGVNLPFQQERYGYEYDIQWNRADQSFTVRNLVFDGTWNRYIYGTKSRSSQSVGESVCKYGKTTGGSYGTIETKSFRPIGGDAPPNATATYIWVRNSPSGGGDSGGPVFWNNTAYGTLVATTDGTDFVYMAVNYVTSGLGVTVLTN